MTANSHPADSATNTGTDLWREDGRAAEPELPHVTIAWAFDELDRIGETTSIASACLIGRGGARSTDPVPRASFMRHRPACVEPTPVLTADRISRAQLIFEPLDDDRVHVRNVGRCALLHNGIEVREADVTVGDTLILKNAIVLLVERRPRLMPSLTVYASGTEFAFGYRDPHGLVGESPTAWLLRDQVAFAAESNHHVLICGESGVGKELAARVVHALSPRGGRPLVARNAATFPETLVDAELFGNAKNYPNVGSPERVGLIGEADQSNLFLDEVGELPLEQQAHLLRVLDAGGEYQRLGESHTRKSRFRLLAATNRPLSELRQDFLARFAVRLRVPGLNERRSDIPPLIRELLQESLSTAPSTCHRFFEDPELGRRPRIAPNLIAALLRHNYTHHVRELTRLLWLSMSSSPGTFLTLTETVCKELDGQPERQGAALTREEVAKALEATGGSKTKAARLLGLKNRFVLYRLLKRLNGDDV